MHRLLAALCAALLAANAACAQPAPLRAVPLPLAAEDAPERLGPFRFAGALHLTSADRRFGGVSGMLVDAGLNLVGVTDAGLWVTARLVIERDRLVGLADLALRPIRDSAGQPLARGFMADAEALARLPDGRLVVAFERWHRMRVHAGPDAPGLYLEAPAGVAQLSGNEGIEALTALSDGRLLAIEEGSDDDRPRRAWLGGAGRAWLSLSYRTTPGWRPTDAAGLPDGGALVLERSFSLFGGFAGRIMHLPAASLAAAAEGAVLAARELARLSPPLLADNFEALAIAPRAAGGFWVFVASDDNFHPLQRTLLLAFVLEALPG